MMPDDARKLLGGYATGTLTSEEREALFAAALHDQSLFDELAKEQVLKEALDDAGIRAELLGVVTERAGSRWLRWWPVPAGALALAALTVALLVNRKPAAMNDVAMTVPSSMQPQIVRAPPPAETILKLPGKRNEKASSTDSRKPDSLPGTGAVVRSEQERPAPIVSEAPRPQVAPAPPSVGAVAPPPAQAERADAQDKEKAVATLNAAAQPAAAGAVGKPGAPAPSNAQVLFEGGAPPSGIAGGAVFRSQALRLEESAAMAKKVEGLARPFSRPGVKYSFVPEGVSVEPNHSGYLQAFTRNSAGAWVDAWAGPQAVKAHVPVTLRAPGGELVLVLAAQIMPALAAGNPKLSTELDSMIAAAKNITGTGSAARFAVNPNVAPDTVLVVLIGAGPR